MLLALATLVALQRWRIRATNSWIAIAGFCVGLTFLNKAEMFLACASASVVALVLHAWSERMARARVLASTLTFAICAFVPVLIALAWLASAMPIEAAWRGTLGSWPGVINGEVSKLYFYSRGMGLDEPGANFVRLLAWAGAFLGLLLPAFALAWPAARRPRSTLFAVVALLFVAGALAWLYPSVRWLQAGRPLPLIVGAIALVALLQLRRWRGDSKRVLAVSLATLALALMPRTYLRYKRRALGALAGRARSLPRA